MILKTTSIHNSRAMSGYDISTLRSWVATLSDPEEPFVSCLSSLPSPALLPEVYLALHSPAASSRFLVESLEQHISVCIRDALVGFAFLCLPESTFPSPGNRGAFLLVPKWLDVQVFTNSQIVKELCGIKGDSGREVGPALRVCMPKKNFDELKDKISLRRNVGIRQEVIPQLLQAANAGSGVAGEARSRLLLRLGEWLVNTMFSTVDGLEENLVEDSKVYSLLKRQVNPLSLMLAGLRDAGSRDPTLEAKAEGLQILCWAIGQNELRWPKKFQDIRSLNLIEYASQSVASSKESIQAYSESVRIDQLVLKEMDEKLASGKLSDIEYKAVESDRKTLKRSLFQNLRLVANAMLIAERFDESVKAYHELVELDQREKVPLKVLLEDYSYTACLHQLIGRKCGEKDPDAKRRHYQESRNCIRRIIELNETRLRSNPEEFTWEFTTLAALSRDMEDWNMAEYYFLVILKEIAPRCPKKFDLPVVYRDLSEVLKARCDFKRAAEFVSKSIEVEMTAQHSMTSANVAKSLKLLATIYRDAHHCLERIENEFLREIEDADLSSGTEGGTRDTDLEDDDRDEKDDDESDAQSMDIAEVLAAPKNFNVVATTSKNVSLPAPQSANIVHTSFDEHHDDALSDDSGMTTDERTIAAVKKQRKILDEEILRKVPTTPEIERMANTAEPLEIVHALKEYNFKEWERRVHDTVYVVKQLAQRSILKDEIKNLTRKYEEGLENGVLRLDRIRDDVVALANARVHTDLAYRIAGLLRATNSIEKSLEMYRVALEGSLRIGPADDRILGDLDELAMFYFKYNRFEDVIVLYEKAVAAYRDRYGNESNIFVGKTLCNQARAAELLRDFPRAILFYENGLTVMNATPNSEKEQMQILQKLFYCATNSNDVSNAFLYGERVRTRLNKYAAAPEATIDDFKALTLFQFEFCATLVAVNRYKDAKQICDAAFEYWSKVVNPDSVAFVPALESRILVYVALEDYETSVSAARLALNLLQIHNHPEATKFSIERVVPILLRKAVYLIDVEALDEDADALLHEVEVELAKTLNLLKTTPNNDTQLEFTANVLYSLGRCFSLQGKLHPAFETFSKAFEILMQLHPGDFNSHPMTSRLHTEMDELRDTIEREEDENDSVEEDEEENEEDDILHEDESDQADKSERQSGLSATAGGAKISGGGVGSVSISSNTTLPLNRPHSTSTETDGGVQVRRDSLPSSPKARSANDGKYNVVHNLNGPGTCIIVNPPKSPTASMATEDFEDESYVRSSFATLESDDSSLQNRKSNDLVVPDILDENEVKLHMRPSPRASTATSRKPLPMVEEGKNSETSLSDSWSLGKDKAHSRPPRVNKPLPKRSIGGLKGLFAACFCVPPPSPLS